MKQHKINNSGVIFHSAVVILKTIYFFFLLIMIIAAAAPNAIIITTPKIIQIKISLLPSSFLFPSSCSSFSGCFSVWLSAGADDSSVFEGVDEAPVVCEESEELGVEFLSGSLLVVPTVVDCELLGFLPSPGSKSDKYIFAWFVSVPSSVAAVPFIVHAVLEANL